MTNRLTVLETICCETQVLLEVDTAVNFVAEVKIPPQWEYSDSQRPASVIVTVICGLLLTAVAGAEVTVVNAVAATLTGVVAPADTVTPLVTPVARTPLVKVEKVPGTESAAATRTRYPVPGGVGIVTVPDVMPAPLMIWLIGFRRPPESTDT